MLNLSSLVILESLLITLSLIISERVMLVNLLKEYRPFYFLKISFESGSIINFSLDSGLLTNNLLISFQ
jgi:hypothetical protein